jgi:two-component system KDP operon response regulator KdpE
VDANPQSALVLVADGDVRAARFASRCLEDSGYRVALIQDAGDILTAEAVESPAVLLIDYDLPGSIDLMIRIREVSDVPIIEMGMDDGPNAAVGLRAAADAFLLKPFAPELLVAQVESVIRRMHLRPAQPHHETYVCGDLSVDVSAHAVTLCGEHVHLSAREFRLLQVLAINAGSVLSHEQLLWLVWGPGYEANSDLLRGYIRKLRRRIGDSARNPRFIETENQIGYWMRRSEDRGAA